MSFTKTFIFKQTFQLHKSFCTQTHIFSCHIFFQSQQILTLAVLFCYSFQIQIQTMSKPSPNTSSTKCIKKCASAQELILSFDLNCPIKIIFDTAPKSLVNTSISVARRTNYNSNQSVDREDHSISSKIYDNKKRKSWSRKNCQSHSSHWSKRHRKNNNILDCSTPNNIKKSSNTTDPDNQIKQSTLSSHSNSSLYSGPGCAPTRVQIPADHIKRVCDYINDKKRLERKRLLVNNLICFNLKKDLVIWNNRLVIMSMLNWKLWKMN